LKELRFMPMEIRSDGEEDKKAVGTGIIYDEWTEIFPGFKEMIVRGAVKKDSVVKSYFNHDPSQVLSTSVSDPPLRLRDSEEGLKYYSPIPPTSYGKDLEVNLERGNVTGSSFAFSVPQDGQKTWEDEGVFYREIKKLTLYEIGPVTDPAYIQTSAQLRTAEDVYKDMVAAKSQADETAAEEARKEERRKASQAEAERERELQLIEKEVK